MAQGVPHRNGVLLVNLGTPNAPTPQAVRRYLNEFLSDPRVIDIPAPFRWLLLNLVILPTRPRRSAAAYAKIWTSEGSPLLVYGNALAGALGRFLGEEFRVQLAMRYGKPSIPDGLRSLFQAGSDRIAIVPLYPQYASSSTGSSLAMVYSALAKEWNVPSIRVAPPFFGTDGFLNAWTAVSRPFLNSFAPDYVLFSFHGLPERQIRKSDRSKNHCLSHPDCCQQVVSRLEAGDSHPVAGVCYRAQCFFTASALARRLGRYNKKHSVSFQSRLGRTKWIEPYTDMVVPQLARQGVKRLAVFCPSFVADCLETLEEIGIRARDDFKKAGGEELGLVPSLNSHPTWTAEVARMVTSLSLSG